MGTVEAGRSQAQDEPELPSEFVASVAYPGPWKNREGKRKEAHAEMAH